METEYMNVKNARTLSFVTSDVCLFRVAAFRFLTAGSLLPQGETICMQMEFGDPEDVRCFVFSVPENSITQEDYGWIFGPQVMVSDREDGMITDIYEKDRHIYMLRQFPSGEETGSGRKLSLYSDDDDDIRELMEMIRGSGAAVRFLSPGKKVSDTAGTGLILLSFPERMPLRMQSMLKLCFPSVRAVETDGTEQTEDAPHLSDRCFSELMASLVEAVIEKSGKDCIDEIYIDDELTDGDMFPDEEDEVSPEMSIDELGLSVRSYNCLRRAGIATVEELVELSDEELTHIRNMGRKSVNEIRRRLSELNYISIPETPAGPSGMEKLQELIGLENVKEQVRKIAAFAGMKKELLSAGRCDIPMCLNMEFSGNPGTAKTTVARIIGEIFREIGITEYSGIVEASRADLVAEYVGQTAVKVKSLFRSARGRVLFIDEAYSLTEDRRGSFGDEAIAAIVQEMENSRDDTVVIFAGYPEEMERFFSLNPGLRSRVPFRLSFSDYTPEEMVKISHSEAEKRGFSIDPGAEGKLMMIFSEHSGRSDCGNGRLCRNTVESALMNYACRVYTSDGGSSPRDFVLREEDFLLPEIPSGGKRSVIGFSPEKTE